MLPLRDAGAYANKENIQKEEDSNEEQEVLGVEKSQERRIKR
jgi:hypothetical protein